MHKRIEALEKQFDNLHDQLVSELSEGDVSVDQLLQSLTKLPLVFRREYESTIQKMLPKLEQRKTIHKLFLRLNPLFTFIDYELLQHLIAKFGSRELKEDMSTYVDKVQLFKKETTVGELINYWPGHKVTDMEEYNYKQLIAKFDDDPKTYTLERLDTFRKKYCSLVSSEFVSVIILSSMEAASSFRAVWLIPAVLVPELLEAASKIDSTFYLEEHVLNVSLDKKSLFLYITESLVSPSVANPTTKPLATFGAVSTIILILRLYIHYAIYLILTGKTTITASSSGHTNVFRYR